MLINLTIGCELDRNSGCSEVGLLLTALSEYRETILQDPASYGANLDAIVAQLDTVVQLVNMAMLRALEGLEPLVIPDGTNDYKTVYEIRVTAGEGGAK